MMKKWMICFILISFSFSAQAAEEISYLDLASLFIRDKNYSRAEVALDKANKDIESYSFERYQLLRGLLLLRQKNYDSAQVLLQKSLNKEETQNLSNLYLSEVYFNKQDYQKAIEYINAVDLIKLKNVEAFVLKARIYWQAKNYDEAMKVLSEGQNVFPKSWRWNQLKIGFFLEKKLFEQAYELTNHHLLQTNYLPKEVLKWARLFNDNFQKQKAHLLLETAMLFHPQNEDLMAAAGQLYLVEKKYLVASHFYRKLSYLNPSYVSPTVSLLRRVDRALQAENLHYENLKQEDRVKDKLSILIDREEYDRVSVLAKEIESLRINDVDEINYALAYSHFMVGNWKESEKKLLNVKDKSYLKKSQKLLSILSTCKLSPGDCYVGL